jgi:predicted SnoaL-like aldol condensation-catalyzing enzyme
VCKLFDHILYHNFGIGKCIEVVPKECRISARFTYDGTLRKPFVGYRPNSAPVQLRSIDIWRVKDGKFVEHWDELNLLEVLQQIGAATVRKSDGQ